MPTFFPLPFPQSDLPESLQPFKASFQNIDRL